MKTAESDTFIQKTSAQTLTVSCLIPLIFVLSAHLTKQTSKRYWTQWLLLPHQGEVSLLPACAIALAQWFMKRRTICAQMGHRYKYSDMSQGGQTTLLPASGDLWQGIDQSCAGMRYQNASNKRAKNGKNSQNKCRVVFVLLLRTIKAHQFSLFLFWSWIQQTTSNSALLKWRVTMCCVDICGWFNRKRGDSGQPQLFTTYTWSSRRIAKPTHQYMFFSFDGPQENRRQFSKMKNPPKAKCSFHSSIDLGQ